MTKVVGHGQAFEAPTIDQAVADKIHAPHFIDGFGDLQRHSLTDRSFGLLALPDRQVGDTIESIHTFVIHSGKLRAQQVMDTPIAKPPPGLGEVDDRSTQGRCLLIRYGRMAITVAG